MGTNPPAQPLTLERIATLPAAAQPAWKDYLARSIGQHQADQQVFQEEMKGHGLQQSVAPPTAHSNVSMPLDNRSVWYGGAEARRLADNVVSFQTPARWLE